MEIVLITGMSGSGKSVALHALEDAGFYCVDNLPPELLQPLVALEQEHHAHKLAIAMDVRSATSLPQVPRQLQALRDAGITVRPLFLDATTDILVRRYSETRRRHPLSQGGTQERALVQAIELERAVLIQELLLAPLRPGLIAGTEKSSGEVMHALDVMKLDRTLFAVENTLESVENPHELMPLFEQATRYRFQYPVQPRCIPATCQKSDSHIRPSVAAL